LVTRGCGLERICVNRAAGYRRERVGSKLEVFGSVDVDGKFA